MTNRIDQRLMPNFATNPRVLERLKLETPEGFSMLTNREADQLEPLAHGVPARQVAQDQVLSIGEVGTARAGLDVS